MAIRFGADFKPKVTMEGQPLYTERWSVANGAEPRALLFIAHGLSEHCSAYNRLCASLNAAGIEVFAHDHYGHGRSPGVRAYVSHMDQMVMPVLSHVTQIRTRFPDKPLFILGHSMGGLVAVLCARDLPHLFNGVVLVAPALGLHAPAWKIWLGTVASYLCPHMLVPGTGCQPQNSTSDCSVQEEIMTDPLQFNLGARLGSVLTLLNCINSLGDYKADFPLLALHSEHDTITDCAKTKDFVDRAKSADKKMLAYQNVRHQLHNEVEPFRLQIHGKIVAWVLDRS